MNNGGMGIYSFLQPIADVISKIITALYNVTVSIGFPSYALAIILISILIKIILFPLMQKQMKSTMNMQEVQPKLEYLQKKYKSNPEKMNEEVMKLYKEYNINPMSGCLPLLIQMPILIGLFGALRQYQFEPVEHATFFWIPNLSEKDPFFILPVLVALTMFIQQKISMGSNESMSANPTMKTMLYVMPAMMLFVCWSMPAGLCLYWAFFSMLSIVQQFFLNKQRDKEKAARAAKEAEEKEKRAAEKKQKMTSKKAAAEKKKVDPENTADNTQKEE